MGVSMGVSTKKSHFPKLEIVLGIVSPLGTNKDLFKKALESQLKLNKIKLVEISLTRELIKFKELQIPKSLEYFLKMQICSELRKKYSNGILINNILSAIRNKRKNFKKNHVVVYLIDQLKNVDESKVLHHIYGKNYVQLSLFSNEHERDKSLEEKFESDTNLVENYDEDTLLRSIIKNILISKKPITYYFGKKTIKNWISDYFKMILPDSTHRLILKDFNEIDLELIDKESGQQVADLFHRAHYFINLDLLSDEVNNEVTKFTQLLLGKYSEYPTQDEFGMCLAYQASVRSNFPGERHVGASIVSKQGEIISVASIRAPAKSSNPTLHDQNKIEPGYKKYHSQVMSWRNFIKEIVRDKKRVQLNSNEKHKLTDIEIFIKNILDFHPCTHAEISAIIDAAKLGVSVRNSTLYTTTFPCHLCAKDIISAGIKRIVYLEAYPKSKNKELYPNLIDFDPKTKSELTPFDFYCGIAPKRFLYVYSLENRSRKNEIPMIQFDVPKYYIEREEDVMKHLKNILHEKKCKSTIHLCGLLNRK